MDDDIIESGGLVARIGLIICLALPFVGVANRELWTPDEPRVAAIALEMAATGNFVVPHLAGEPFVEKPPLYFAFGALSARAAGHWLGGTGAVRLASALWALLALAASWILGRRLVGSSAALVGVMLLATMHGFVFESHWIRVDIALVACVAGAVACLAEMYLGNRRWLCVPAGVLTAGAFLSKGVIGVAFVGTAWVALAIPWFICRWRSGDRTLWVVPHMVGLISFAVPTLAWVLSFRASGGPELWQQWFWANQVGRMDGSAPELGHVHGGGIFSYFDALFFFTLPWVAGLVLWLGLLYRELRARTLSRERLFMAIWSGLVLLMLSVSATKRDLYLAPLMPVLALVCAEALIVRPPRWLSLIFIAWGGVCIAGLAVMTLSPLLTPLVSGWMPPEVAAVVGAPSMLHLVCLLALVAALLFFARYRATLGIAHMAAVTALAYVGYFVLPVRAMDEVVSMKPGLVSFADSVTEEGRSRTAGHAVTESMVGYLYCHTGWALPIIDEARAMDVLMGRDREYAALVVNPRRLSDSLTNLFYAVEAEYEPVVRARRKTYQWIQKATAPTGQRPGRALALVAEVGLEPTTYGL